MPDSRRPVGGVRRRLRSVRYVVADGSMRPALEPGDRVLVDPAPVRHGPPAVGTIVVLVDPESPGRRLVKRVASVAAGGTEVTVVGDRPEVSRDSRTFGPVPLRALVGVVWFRYLPADRRGPT